MMLRVFVGGMILYTLYGRIAHGKPIPLRIVSNSEVTALPALIGCATTIFYIPTITFSPPALPIRHSLLLHMRLLYPQSDNIAHSVDGSASWNAPYDAVR